MAKRDEKVRVIAELEEKFRNSKAAIFADYRGLNVDGATVLRRSFRSAGAELRVVKNTLTQIAAERSGFQELHEFLTGPTAVAFDLQDPIIPAKLLIDFAKTNKNLHIKGGLVEGRVVGSEEIKFLAGLPGREVLIAQTLRGLQGPLVGLASVLQGPLRKLVFTLKAIHDQKAAV